MSHTRLVIVADDSIVRLDLCELLQALGYQVVGEAGDGLRALTLACELRPDLVLLELHLSGPLDGLDVASALTSEQVAPILLLAAFDDIERVHQVVQAGVAGYLVMPFDEDQLRLTLELVLTHHQAFQALAREAATCSNSSRSAESWTCHGRADEAPARQGARGRQAHPGGKHERTPTNAFHCRRHPACHVSNPRPSAGHPEPQGSC